MEYSLSFTIALDGESRHPLSEPAQWVAAYSHRQYRMRRLSDRAQAFFPSETEGREEEGRGRPMRMVRLMVTTHRPRPEGSRRETSLSKEIPEEESHSWKALRFSSA